MTHLGSFAVPGEATFGRDGAMFESLLGFVAQLSLVLWIVVTLTLVIRFVGIRFYRRAARRAQARAAAPGPLTPGPLTPGPLIPGAAIPTIIAPGVAGPAANTAAIGARSGGLRGIQPPSEAPSPAVAAPAVVPIAGKVPVHAALNPRVEPRATAHFSALATHSVDG